MTRVLVIDHRDSFVFNLVDDLLRLGAEVDVLRSDVSIQAVQEHVAATHPDLLLLSPGPGRPEESGVMIPLLEAEPELPVLGVCLGLQAMVIAHGGEVGRAQRVVHGRATAILHDESGIFEGIPAPMPGARYHSLCATRVPDCMEVIASARAEEMPMALRHRTLPRIGLQFHPESILTPDGPALIANVVRELTGSALAEGEA